MKHEETLAHRMRKFREAGGIAKAELARRVGVSDVAISYWESGEIKQVGHERLLALAAALGISVSELLGDPMGSAFQVDVADDISNLLENNAADGPLTLREGHKLVDLGGGRPYALVEHKVRLIDPDDVSVRLNGTCHSAGELADDLEIPEDVVLRLANEADIDMCTTCNWWCDTSEMELVDDEPTCEYCRDEDEDH